MQQVDYDFQFVHTLEIGKLGLVSGFDKRIKASFDQLGNATAQHRLLSEQVGFGLSRNCGWDHASSRASDRFGISQPDRKRRHHDCRLLLR